MKCLEDGSSSSTLSLWEIYIQSVSYKFEMTENSGVISDIVQKIEGNEPFSRALIIFGTIFLFVSVILWIGSLRDYLHFIGYAYVFFAISMSLLHFGMVVYQGDSESKIFIWQSNALSAIGVVSIPFGLSSWIFLGPGLFMALFAYFILKIPEARNTQYVWGNALIALSAYITTLNIQYFHYISTATQLVGFSLIGMTLYRLGYTNESKVRTRFDYFSFRILSSWGLILALSIFVWLLFLHDTYNGVSWFLEGIILLYSVSKMYDGIWIIWNPAWILEFGKEEKMLSKFNNLEK